MKTYTIKVNEDQLRLMCSALELQMRVRIGQGFAITENVTTFKFPDDVDLQNTEKELTRIIKPLVIMPGQHDQFPHLARTRWIERDMWKSCEHALGMTDADIGLSIYGFPEVTQHETQ